MRSADGNGSGKWTPTLSDVPGYAEQKAQSKKRINPIKLKQIKERHQQVEEDIARLEDGISECERELQSFVSAEATARWTGLLAKRRGELGPADGGVGRALARAGASQSIASLSRIFCLLPGCAQTSLHEIVQRTSKLSLSHGHGLLRLDCGRNHHPVAAFRFGLVQRFVGCLNNVARGRAMFRKACNSDRQGNPAEGLAAMTDVQVRDLFPELLSPFATRFYAGLRQDQEELLASIAAGNIATPCYRGEPERSLVSRTSTRSALPTSTHSPPLELYVDFRHFRPAVSSTVLPPFVSVRTTRHAA